MLWIIIIVIVIVFLFIATIVTSFMRGYNEMDVPHRIRNMEIEQRRHNLVTEKKTNWVN